MGVQRVGQFARSEQCPRASAGRGEKGNLAWDFIVCNILLGFFGVTPEYMAGGSWSFHLLSWALANMPCLFAWGLPTFFPLLLSHSKALQLPSASPSSTLPTRGSPHAHAAHENCRGLLQGYERHRSPGGAEHPQNEHLGLFFGDTLSSPRVAKYSSSVQGIGKVSHANP